jgi:hypothetical protein
MRDTPTEFKETKNLQENRPLHLFTLLIMTVEEQIYITPRTMRMFLLAQQHSRGFRYPLMSSGKIKAAGLTRFRSPSPMFQGSSAHTWNHTTFAGKRFQSRLYGRIS